MRTTFGLIDNASCMLGFNLVIPFVQNISLVNNKQQDLRFSDQIWSETQEQTVVYMENVTVTYQIVPESSAWIYANVENWVQELVDIDIVSSALKSASGGWPPTWSPTGPSSSPPLGSSSRPPWTTSMAKTG